MGLTEPQFCVLVVIKTGIIINVGVPLKKRCERAFTKKKADVTGDRVRGDFLFLFLFGFLIL